MQALPAKSVVITTTHMAKRGSRGNEAVRHANVPERWAYPGAGARPDGSETSGEFLVRTKAWTSRSAVERVHLHKAVSDGFVMGRHIQMLQKWLGALDQIGNLDLQPPTSPENVFGAPLGFGDPLLAGLPPINALATAMWPFVENLRGFARRALDEVRAYRASVDRDAAAGMLLGHDARKLILLLVVRAERQGRLSVPVTPPELEGVYADVVCDACAKDEAESLLVDPRRSTEAWRVALSEHRGRPGGKPIHRSRRGPSPLIPISVKSVGFVEVLERQLSGRSPEPGRRSQKRLNAKLKK